jgi:hypothetical protein
MATDSDEITDQMVDDYIAGLDMTDIGVSKRKLTMTKFSKEPLIAERICALRKKELKGNPGEYKDAMDQLLASHREAVRVHIDAKAKADALRAKHAEERFQALERDAELEQQHKNNMKLCEKSAVKLSELQRSLEFAQKGLEHAVVHQDDRKKRKAPSAKRKVEEGQKKEEEAPCESSPVKKKAKKQAAKKQPANETPAVALSPEEAAARRLRKGQLFVDTFSRAEAEEMLLSKYPSMPYLMLTVHQSAMAYPFDVYLLYPIDEAKLDEIDKKLEQTKCNCKFDPLYWGGLISKHKKGHTRFTRANPTGESMLQPDDSIPFTWTMPQMRTVVWPSA